MMNGTLLVIEGKVNGKSEWMKSYKQKVQTNDSENMHQVKKIRKKIVNYLHLISEISRECNKLTSELSIMPFSKGKLMTTLRKQ